MDAYCFPEHAEGYLIQGTESNSHLASPFIDQLEAMYNEGTPEFVVEQGLYYPTATNYGFICTGLESPSDWDDHLRISGQDGQDIQYAGVQTESFPYVYYTTNNGYSQSPYNPYNPYIPGAMVGADGSFIGTEQYYTIPGYENTASSPAYFPMVVQSNHPTDLFMDTTASITSRVDGPSLKNKLSSASATFTMNAHKSASNQTNSFSRVLEGSKGNAGSSKQLATVGSVTAGGFSNPASSQVPQGRGAQPMDDGSQGKIWSSRSQLKVSIPSGNELSTFGSSVHGRTMVDKVRPKFHFGRFPSDLYGSPDALTEQNRGPRTNKLKNHLSVKAYTTKAGDSDAQGNIIIHTDRYNKDYFPIDYVSAKFFVIKSYSEDDVHKSIKYNVWSSTPNGNKKLNSAYYEAQKIATEPGGCPIFLFFSVNASGQFCGVAEMTGPVDFHKDMDFWQQDKWSGSFAVKWHIIKDVPNPIFRHIILENNENKPVTNSRDTQEIRYNKGLEMLKVFKNHTSKTSLLDDFMYYENRQKLLREDKARLLIKSYQSPFLVSTIEPPRKLHYVTDLPSSEAEKATKNNDLNGSEMKGATPSPTEQVSLEADVSNLSITDGNAKHVVDEKANQDKVKKSFLGNTPNGESKPLERASPPPAAATAAAATAAAATAATATATATASGAAAVVANTKGYTEPVDGFTVGSMPVNVKVNGFAKSSGYLTVGTIPLDPKALKSNEAGVSFKFGSQKG